MDTAEKLIRESQVLFTTEDFMIIALVAAVVLFMPFFVFGLKKRSYVAVISLIVLMAYAAGELYFTFFNRHSMVADSWNVLTPMADIDAAFRVDLGVIGLIKEIIHGNAQAALASIHVESARKAREVLLNVLLYLPLGYLLPFVSKKFRRPSAVLLIGFLCSLATELGQYYTKLGYFQVDDLICNTMGALIGGLIGIALCAIWRIE